MAICIYITDSKWFSFLRENNITQGVNFWRRDTRNFNLNPNDYFYFKIRESNFISGRGQFVGFENLSLIQAWQAYGINCGHPNFGQFQTSLHNLYPDLDVNAVNIQCIELNNIQWLRNDQFIEVTEELFSRQTQAFKNNFTPWEIHNLNESFDNKINDIFQDSITNEELEPNAQYTEGSVKLSLHKTIERNQNLIQTVKQNRAWICEICKLDFNIPYSVNYIEGHHKIPLHLSGETLNQPADIALLCPNCHKAVHKIMVTNPGMDYEGIATFIRNRING